jgi:Flp pilus assembly protein TadG
MDKIIINNSTPKQVTMNRSSGQELVEYALILPILLVLLLGIMELGLAVFNYDTMSNAAREAARTGIITRDETTIRSAGLKLTTGTALSTTNITIFWLPENGDVTVPSGDAVRVRVQVTRNYPLLTGSLLALFGLRGTLPMTATATMHLE